MKEGTATVLAEFAKEEKNGSLWSRWWFQVNTTQGQKGKEETEAGGLTGTWAIDNEKAEASNWKLWINLSKEDTVLLKMLLLYGLENGKKPLHTISGKEGQRTYYLGLITPTPDASGSSRRRPTWMELYTPIKLVCGRRAIPQTPWIDYEETFSPVADIRAIRILKAHTVYYDYEILANGCQNCFPPSMEYLNEEGGGNYLTDADDLKVSDLDMCIVLNGVLAVESKSLPSKAFSLLQSAEANKSHSSAYKRLIVLEGHKIDFNIEHPPTLSTSSLLRLFRQSGMESIGLLSRNKLFNIDMLLKSNGKDSLDKLLFVRDKHIHFHRIWRIQFSVQYNEFIQLINTAYPLPLDTAYRLSETEVEILCMTRSSTNELFTPYKEPEREFRSSKRHFKTLSLDELRSPDFNLLSDQEYSEEEEAETMTETMYMSKTRTDYGSGVARPKIDNKYQFELKGQFLKELRENTFSGSVTEDANKHIKKVLEIIDLFHVPNITVDQLMLRVFHISLTGAASRWLRNKPTEPDETLYQAWERFKELLMKCPQHYLTEMQEVILFYNGLDIPTRQILDSRGVIPTMTATDAKTAIQEMAEYSQKWHNGTSRERSTETFDGLAAIQAQLNNLGREIKKVNEKVYAA
ncbi:hypothetical protein Tco_1473825 [Tanacetum coccineum]